jgi:formamidopyrimidine-DNA glycosylase
MPELPEVEVTRAGLAPHLDGASVSKVILRRSGLRWPFPENLATLLERHIIRGTGRRGKYLLIYFDHGCLIIHLGMSGHLRMVEASHPAAKHDHFDLVVHSASRVSAMRLTDARRFGAVLWHAQQDGPVENHPLLRKLGIEPLSEQFSARLLYQASRTRSTAIKQVLLAGDIVVGVGNIYASESLFRAGIHPATAAKRIGLLRYEKLAQAIREILAAAITQGGSTLRDFSGADGKPGYFQQSYFVYDRANLPCRVCNGIIRQLKQGQRSTFYCASCQK